MTDIIIPNLGNEISEAEITEWLVSADEEVEEGGVVGFNFFQEEEEEEEEEAATLSNSD